MNTKAGLFQRYHEGSYLGFDLGGEQYLMPIRHVRMVRGWKPSLAEDRLIQNPTAQPLLPPVVDLAAIMGFESCKETAFRCVIIVEWLADSGFKTVAVTVDTIADVLYVSADDIEENPHAASDFDGRFVVAFASTGGRIRKIIDVESVLEAAELSSRLSKTEAICM